MCKQVVVSSIKLIEQFLNTLKCFPSEYYFNNQKNDIHLGLFALLNSPVNSAIFTNTSNLMTAINILNTLSYQSSYYAFVQVFDILHSIKDELEDYLDNVEDGI